MLVAVVAHLHDVGEDLDDHNVGKLFCFIVQNSD